MSTRTLFTMFSAFVCVVVCAEIWAQGLVHGDSFWVVDEGDASSCPAGTGASIELTTDVDQHNCDNDEYGDVCDDGRGMDENNSPVLDQGNHEVQVRWCSCEGYADVDECEFYNCPENDPLEPRRNFTHEGWHMTSRAVPPTFPLPSLPTSEGSACEEEAERVRLLHNDFVVWEVE